ncbi:MAG TPA: hypothetical protein VMM13_01430 [Euzebya sp.]|nr:hypothetical protein [Euzebya sp.]
MRDEVAMGLTELRTEHTLPEWTVCFLRARGQALQRSLVSSDGELSPEEAEEDSIHCWRLLLLAAAELPAAQLVALEELHLLHAQIVERMDRGGVGDICQDVEFLVCSVLVDRLQRLTDSAVSCLAG